MKNGRYFAQFTSNVGGFGNGVVEVRDGVFSGGDDQYRYTGTVTGRADAVVASVEVERHAVAAVSIFGPADRFSLVLKGYQSGTMVLLNGNVEGQPNLQIGICLTSLQEEPA